MSLLSGVLDSFTFTSTKASDSWEKYSNDTLGFSLKIPTDWEVKEQNDGTYLVKILGKPNTEYANDKSAIFISKYNAENSNTNLIETQEISINGLKATQDFSKDMTSVYMTIIKNMNTELMIWSEYSNLSWIQHEILNTLVLNTN